MNYISLLYLLWLVVYDGYLSGVTVMAVPITGEDLLHRVT